MPTLPWTIPNPAPPGMHAYAMASRFEVRSAPGRPALLAEVTRAWRQVRSAPGCLGASLIAQPLQRVFYTLSAWQDRDALYASPEPSRTAALWPVCAPPCAAPPHLLGRADRAAAAHLG